MRWYDRGPMPYILVIGGLVLAAAVVVGLMCLWADFIHGDWRCAFAQCRIEKQ